METRFTDEEKTAIASVLCNLAEADYQTQGGEGECLKACLDELGFEAKEFVPIERKELPKKAYVTLKNMTGEKKREFSRMMTQVSRSDGHFGPRERAFVKEILDMCNVPFVHR